MLTLHSDELHSLFFLKCETLDPTTLKLSDLTGHEKVGVVNRNTQERVCEKQMLLRVQTCVCPHR